MSVGTASGFIPVTPPSYIPSGHPNVYLSGSTGTTLTYKYNNPPYIYTTDSSLLSGAVTGSYRLRCKAFYYDGSNWQILPNGAEHRACGFNNQYETIKSPQPGVYRYQLYWIKYPTGPFGSSGTVYSGTPYYVDVTVTP